MISYTEQKEQWYQQYSSSSLDGRYEMMMEMLDNPPSDDVLIEDDFGAIVISLRDDFIHEKKFEEILGLIEKIKKETPTFYRKNFPYLSNSPIEYNLYTGNMEVVQEHFKLFINNPTADLDLFIPLFNKLRYYQENTMAIEIAEKMIPVIVDSDELISGAELELVEAIFYSLFENYYTILEMGKESDWQQLVETLERYDYDNNMFEFVLPEIKQNLDAIAKNQSASLFTKEEWASVVEENFTTAVRKLYWEFAVYMLKQKQISFSVSNDMWFYFVQLLQKQNTKTDFSFQKSDLEEKIAGFVNHPLSKEEEVGFTLLWGIPYIYDFLSDQQFVTAEVKQKSLDHVKAIKEKIMRIYSDDLWRFDYVHSWKKPTSVELEEINDEQYKFKKSFTEPPKKSEAGTLPPSDYMEQLSMFDDSSGGQTNKRKPKNTKNKKKQAKKQRKKNRKK